MIKPGDAIMHDTQPNLRHSWVEMVSWFVCLMYDTYSLGPRLPTRWHIWHIAVPKGGQKNACLVSFNMARVAGTLAVLPVLSTLAI